MRLESDARTLTRAVENRALELGFGRIGFAPAAPPARAEFFRRWLAEGKGGTMTYLNRSADRRANPQLVLPGAKTVVSVAQSYFTGRLPDAVRNDPARGLIASYAWGSDYHDVLLGKLRELAAFVEQLAPGHVSRSYVDTGHIMERDHAEQAGIGFRGKNTLLIAPRMGSTFILGEILSTLELPPSPPARMPSCGSCTRCLEACPTHALPAAYVLDSTLCISYLTIEYRGVIPRQLRSKIGNRIFGCDDCQDCCPWNTRFAAETEEASYRAALDRQAPLLCEMAALDEDRFLEKFAGSAVLRARHAGMLRNVAVALGNWVSEEAVPPLDHLAHSSHSIVRAHAVWGLTRIRSDQADRILTTIKQRESDPQVRVEFAAAEDERQRRARGAPSE